MSIVESDGPPSFSLDASETGESTKCLWVQPVGEGRVRVGLTGFPPQFRSHQETKIAARRTQRSASTISRKNRRLRTVYAFYYHSMHFPFNFTEWPRAHLVTCK